MNIEIDNWILCVNTIEDEKYMPHLFQFTVHLLKEVFPDMSMWREPCRHYNEPSAECPMLIHAKAGISLPVIELRTSATKLSYWSQYIFPLSHELTHYIIRQHKLDKSVTLKWFEETLCEAMSIFVLKEASERWEECSLAKLNPSYGKLIKTYYEDYYNDTAADVLNKCTSYEELQEIEDNCEKNRKDRSIMRNYLFDIFVDMPDDISSIVYYTLFVRDKLCIDFSLWKKSEYNSKILSELEYIQPVVAMV